MQQPAFGTWAGTTDFEVTPGRYTLMSGDLIEAPDQYRPRHAKPRPRPPFESSWSGGPGGSWSGDGLGS